MFGLDNDQTARLFYLVLLLAFIAAGLGPRRGGWVNGLRNLLVWVALAVGFVAAYAYRAPLLRIAAPVLREFQPSRVVEVTDSSGRRELSVGRGLDGHFHIDGKVNDEPIEFLVDTGASSTVLTIEDAERAGIETKGLAFDRPVQTANGMAFYAQVTAQTLDVGPFRLNDLPVAIMPAGSLSTSLLGMNTINRFAAWRVEGERMVLVP
jgi:aspartyl protease family protein